MSDSELRRYFDEHLTSLTGCGNKTCSCLVGLFTSPQNYGPVSQYLVWFERKTKYDQDSIIAEWYKYASANRGRKMMFMLPFKVDSVEEGECNASIENLPTLAAKTLCTKGIRSVMQIGKKRWEKVASASKLSGVLPRHKSTGKPSPRAIDDERAAVLKEHFEYLLELGEVRATRVVATLVDGEHGHTNREDTTDMVYLPSSFGFRPCYKRYMEGLGYAVTCRPNGGIIVEGIDGKEIDHSEFVSFTTYCRVWKNEYPQLKVSSPVEDICQYCFVFANRHRYLANHSAAMTVCAECDEDGDEVTVVRNFVVNENETPEPSSTANETSKEMNTPHQSEESAATAADEEREVLLLKCAIHIKMARAQRALYQAKIVKAVTDAKAGIVHQERTYTFVVDYGQNMELPVYNTQQPGCTYYYSPLSVYNLGMVDHAHVNDDGNVGAHMYAHVYHEGVGKKGANNVSSLIVKTLQKLNLLQDDSVGGELNIIFDNCSGQNKNNTVLKLAMWLKAMGYFKCVNFIFLIVGHTKNAADRLFNSLKHEYRKKNLYTMEELIESLNVSTHVTVIPTRPEDFFDYDSLFKDLFRNLASKIKQNHIFSCQVEDRMYLRESNVTEHTTKTHKCSKKGRHMTTTDLRVFSLGPALVNVHCIGINPYKMVELHFKYCMHVPIKYQNNILYARPDDQVMSLVKLEKSERSTFRAQLKRTKLDGMKARLESIAYLDDDGNVDVSTGDSDGDEGDI